MTALPPKGFVGAGTIQRVEQCNPPWWSSEKPLAGPALRRYERGLHYQQVVEHAIRAWADSWEQVRVEFGPWFRFVGSNQPSIWRWCQPDAVVHFGNNPEAPALVLEVKLAFEPRAWWQLHGLYQPVLVSALARPVFCAAICKSYDPEATRGIVTSPWFGSAAQWLETLWRTAVILNDARLLTCKPAVPPTIESLRFPGLPVLQWKRPSIDSISESAQRITQANQPGSR